MVADNVEGEHEYDPDPITRRSKRTMQLINCLIVLVVLWVMGRAFSAKFAQISQKISAVLMVVALVALWGVHAYGLRKTRREDLERVRFLTAHDGLTKLHNFHYLARRIEEEVERSKRYAHPFCVLYLKLDRFKEAVNTYGQKAGDRVLVAVAGALRDTCRVTDTLGRALGRVGTDEFVVLMPEADATGGLLLAQRIIKAVVGLRVELADGREIDFVGVSVGAAIYPYDGQRMKALLQKAGAAVTQARRAGGNCFVDARGMKKRKGGKQRSSHS